MIKIKSVEQHREIGKYISGRLAKSTEPEMVKLLERLQARNDACLQIAEAREKRLPASKKKSVFSFGRDDSPAFAPICEQIA